MTMFDRWRRRIVDYRNPDSLASRIRSRRLHVVRALVVEAARNGATILDVGGTVEYWRLVGLDLLRANGVRVTLINLQPLDVAADARDVLAAQAGDACDLSRYADRSFALVISNSVIEHVGPWARMQLFADEIRRVARTYYVQTPNFWFPIELHFLVPCLHWLPLPLRARVLRRWAAAQGHVRTVAEARKAAQEIRLLDWRDMRRLFPDATLRTEWFAGLPKSLIAIRLLQS